MDTKKGENMNRQDWDEAMLMIDDDLLSEAAEAFAGRHKKKKRQRFFAGLAAAVIMLGTAYTVIRFITIICCPRDLQMKMWH